MNNRVLSRRFELVIEKRENGQTFREIGEFFEVTRSHAHQMYIEAKRVQKNLQ